MRLLIFGVFFLSLPTCFSDKVDFVNLLIAYNNTIKNHIEQTVVCEFQLKNNRIVFSTDLKWFSVKITR